MPSWNIHLYHATAALDASGSSRLKEELARIQAPFELTRQAFLLGNVVPDIYVGYMVRPATKLIRYHITHFTDHAVIPVPDHEAFWDRYGRFADKNTSDYALALGAWAHLAADHVYNQHTRSFLAAHGIAEGERARVGKQTDFQTYGTHLPIGYKLVFSQELAACAHRFKQYSIAEADLRRAIDVANGFVAENRRVEVEDESGRLEFIMLDQQFFDDAQAETQAIIDAGPAD